MFDPERFSEKYSWEWHFLGDAEFAYDMKALSRGELELARWLVKSRAATGNPNWAKLQIKFDRFYDRFNKAVFGWGK